MTLASPSDFASAHHVAYQAVGRVLGRVTGSRAIEAVQDGFVVAVEVEGYDEPFEVAAGYEGRRGWVAEIRDGTGRVWAVGAGARLPEAVASMGRAGNPPSRSPRPPKRWSSQGPASRKIYAKGLVPSATKTSPHLKKLYRALLKHYTARVALTKKGRTWDEVATILKIRPKGRPSVALWGKALAERVFYAKVRGLVFSKDMIGKLPRAGR